MPTSWTLVVTHPTRGCTFQRPLDPLEICFLWDGLFNGTEDSLHHYEVSLSVGSHDAQLFSEANIVRAWLSTKRRFPLAGAIVRGADGGPFRLDESKADVGTGFVSEPHFVVREHDLTVLRPQEVVFGSVASPEEAQRQAVAIMHGPRLLSEDLLVRLYVFRESDPQRAGVLHLMVAMAHCVTDGVANRTLVRCFLDTLARGGVAEPAQVPLEERLAMAVPPTDVEPAHLRALSPAMRRWRRAVGIVIFELRKTKTQGGHTLPCRLTPSTTHAAARPGTVSTSLTYAQTAAVIATCRLHGVTFGHAFLVVAQVAMTRVLYRRYLRGEISEEEWTYRKRQPHINGGPLNLRPYLDKAWYERGGGSEFMLCISLFVYQLPFMTLGITEDERDRHALSSSNGAPPFGELLTCDRFVHRARLVKKQATAFFGHPLLFEILQAQNLAYLQHTRMRALRWKERAVGETADGDSIYGIEDEDKVLAVTDVPMIWAHGGSSLGNLDLISPVEYPLPPTHPLSPYSSDVHPMKAGYVTPPSSSPSDCETTPRIVVESSRVHLRTPPAELYLGAATSHGQMQMYVHYDGNVFEEGVVNEWLDEVREAVLWYLGDGDGQAGCAQAGSGHRNSFLDSSAPSLAPGHFTSVSLTGRR